MPESIQIESKDYTELEQLYLRVTDLQVRIKGYEFLAEPDPLPILRHLGREVGEAIKEPFDHEEYADMLILLFAACAAIKLGPNELVKAAHVKMNKNDRRQWQKPDEEGVVEHDRRAD